MEHSVPVTEEGAQAAAGCAYISTVVRSGRRGAPLPQGDGGRYERLKREINYNAMYFKRMVDKPKGRAPTYFAQMTLSICPGQ